MRLTENQEPVNGDFAAYVEELINNSPTGMLIKQRLLNGDLASVFSGTDSSLAKVRKQHQQQMSELRQENVYEANKIKQEARNVHNSPRANQESVFNNNSKRKQRNQPRAQKAQYHQQYQQQQQPRYQHQQHAQTSAQSFPSNNQRPVAKKKKNNIFTALTVFGVFFMFVLIFGDVSFEDVLPLILFMIIVPIIMFVTSVAEENKKKRNQR